MTYYVFKLRQLNDRFLEEKQSLKKRIDILRGQLNNLRGQRHNLESSLQIDRKRGLEEIVETRPAVELMKAERDYVKSQSDIKEIELSRRRIAGTKALSPAKDQENTTLSLLPAMMAPIVTAGPSVTGADRLNVRQGT